MTELLHLENYSFTYPQQRRPALSHVTLTLPEGAFMVLCGPSGCGKSTLLRQLKTVLAPHGLREGEITFCGTPLSQIPSRRQAAEIGFVQQSPENQVVTDKVWHELAFGLESLGFDTPTIRRRVAEMASFFGIQDWFYKNVTELSGGQKQLLSLASVMVMQPRVLILDEPTSQLDPIAASDFLQTLGRINRELGTTVLLTEHRLEEALPLATHAAVMDGGRLLCTGAPAEVGGLLRQEGHRMFLAMPSAMRIWASVQSDASCPVTVREGRAFLTEWLTDHPAQPLPPEEIPPCGEVVLAAEDVWFKYEEKGPDIVRGLHMTVRQGEFMALLGGNGTGKSTTLRLLSEGLRPYRGTVRHTGRLGVLPQNPQALFVKKTVREDLFETFDGLHLPPAEQQRRVEQMVTLCRLTELLDRHPYDLSGGEQQRAALAKVMLLEPDILLMDEPTKGLDAEFKQSFAAMVRSLLSGGVTVLMVSHDVEFCARYAHRCALFFDGSISAEGTPRAFFGGNSFYTTSADRMARGLLPHAVTAEDVMAGIGGTVPPEPEVQHTYAPLPPAAEESADWKPPKLPWWRKALAAVSGAVALVILWMATRKTDLTALVGGGKVSAFGLQLLAAVGSAGQVGLNIAGSCPVCVQLAPVGFLEFLLLLLPADGGILPVDRLVLLIVLNVGEQGVDVLDPALRFPHAVTDSNGGFADTIKLSVKGFHGGDFFLPQKLHCRLHLVEVGNSALELALGSPVGAFLAALLHVPGKQLWDGRLAGLRPCLCQRFQQGGLSLFQFRDPVL